MGGAEEVVREISERLAARGPDAGLIAPGRMHETGFTFVDVAGAARLVEELFGDKDRRRDMGSRGRKSMLERYTWDRITDR